MLAVVVLGLFVLLFLGVPVSFALAITSMIYLSVEGIPVVSLAQRMIAGTDSFSLIAAPLFMLAGQIMSTGGITKRLVRLSDALIGHVPGGLAQVNIVVSMIFAGMSGSATADAAGLGSMLIPAMKEDGYDAPFSAAVTAASSTLGPIIPPSVPFVIYGSIAQISIGKLFLGGAIPGLVMALYMMLVVHVLSLRRGYRRRSLFSLSRLFSALRESALELMLPLIIVGGIMGGVFTPTEAAVIAVVYALILEVLVRKELTTKDLPQVFLRAAVISGVVMFIVASASIFGWILVREQFGRMVVGLLTGLSTNPVILRAFIIGALFVMGLFVETIASIIIVVPVVLPLATALGMDPIHLGVVTVLTIMIGLITPPVGLCMYIVTAIARINVVAFTREALPFIAALILAVLTIAYFPGLVLWLPNLLIR
ncbi:MAG: TRAP transporter large permease [Bacillota bacterium]|jgi:C4-dicarboxylate transporter DctM subunit